MEVKEGQDGERSDPEKRDSERVVEGSVKGRRLKVSGSGRARDLVSGARKEKERPTSVGVGPFSPWTVPVSSRGR